MFHASGLIEEAGRMEGEAFACAGGTFDFVARDCSAAACVWRRVLTTSRGLTTMAAVIDAPLAARNWWAREMSLVFEFETNFFERLSGPGPVEFGVK